MRTEKNGLTVWFPTFQAETSNGDPHKSVIIIDDPLRHAMFTAARNAYRVLGGTEAEWKPRAAPPLSCKNIQVNVAASVALNSVILSISRGRHGDKRS